MKEANEILMDDRELQARRGGSRGFRASRLEGFRVFLCRFFWILDVKGFGLEGTSGFGG